jgi:hypothetical protein
MISVRVKAAWFKAAIGIEQGLTVCLVAGNDVFLILHWERGEVIVAQDRRGEELRVKGERGAFQTWHQAETAIDRAAARGKGHLVVPALSVEAGIKPFHDLKPGLLFPPVRQRKDAWSACPDLCLILQTQCDLACKRGVPGEDDRQADEISVQAPYAWVALNRSDQVPLRTQPISELVCAETVVRCRAIHDQRLFHLCASVVCGCNPFPSVSR